MMKFYRVSYNVAGWIEEKIVVANNKKEARRKARVARIISIQEVK